MYMHVCILFQNQDFFCECFFSLTSMNKLIFIQVIYILYIYIYVYLYHDGATLQSELPWYITDTLPRVVYFTLMFDILPACG